METNPEIGKVRAVNVKGPAGAAVQGVQKGRKGGGKGGGGGPRGRERVAVTCKFIIFKLFPWWISRVISVVPNYWSIDNL